MVQKTGESPEQAVGRLLRERGLTLATAESCTGGGIGARITSVPGSSAYYLGGVIAYHNDVKRERLGVSAETLEAHGAVSEGAAREMARGVKRGLRASLGLSVTGIAGPGGGTPDKPVGTVYIGVSSDRGEAVRHFVFQGDRDFVRARTGEEALALLREHLETPDAVRRDRRNRTGSP